ncbi:cytochrome-c peroxidase [Flavobacterium algicola]|uniref:cytochrome-c peroxidase n=1 Tax=Flavobacterium algicola TaxID=556529 RepID=UPI001EFC6918|nr:cytochrome c peroxidase [Flavobacterium algicola]MCG9793354.1 cytochrome-c peroxidase [Flavobacterium algicola]
MNNSSLHTTFYLLIICLFTVVGCQKKQTEISPKQLVLIDIEKLSEALIEFKNLANTTDNSLKLQKKFSQCRLLYKQTEWVVSYFIPETARFINGPALDELEVAENQFVPPNGFQVVEEIIYPEYDAKNKEELLREITILSGNIRQVKQALDVITISPSHIIDAIKLDVFRNISLGITGFDSPIAFLSIPESAASLNAIEQILPTIDKGQTKTSSTNIYRIIAAGKKYCLKHPDFNDFDRAYYIKTILNPLIPLLNSFKTENNIETISRNSVVNPEANSYFAENTFSVNSFIPSSEFAYSKDKKELGDKLFYDVNLSKNNNRSCASCHNPDKAFTDGLKSNLALSGGFLLRNTPTLTYAGLQNAQFWDMRQLDLEKQSADVVGNIDEMHSSIKDIIPIVENDEKYKVLFKKAFPRAKKVEEWQIQNALASYTRSLNLFNSKFDLFMRNKTTFSEEESKGFNLFAGKAKCATCHFIPIFNGTVPPQFKKTEHEIIGTPEDKAGKKLSPDMGRYTQYKMDQLRNSFKTPTLRNVEITGPYMHNGVFTTLEEVVDFYNEGGGVGLGLPVPNQTLPSESLNLTESEKKALVAFMKTLSDIQ